MSDPGPPSDSAPATTAVPPEASPLPRQTRVHRATIIAAIVRKDLWEYSHDRLWMMLSALGLVAFVLIFWLLPATVDETITVGLYHQGLGELGDELADGMQEGLRVVVFPSSDDLRAAVAGTLSEEAAARLPGARDVRIGLAFPPGFAEDVAADRKAAVTVFIDGSVPAEFRTGMTSLVREIAYQLAGRPLPVSQMAPETIILGEDRSGQQVSLREKMRPLFAFVVLLIESFALSSLIAAEIQERTVTAILATPARVGDVVAAKGLTGTLLAVGQALIFLAAVRSFTGNVSALIVGVVLGAAMAAGIGMVAGAAGKDFMGTLSYGMLFLVPMVIPAFSALFPGTASAWVKVFPSYGVVETMIRSTAYDATWAVVAPYVAIAAVWCVAIFGGGAAVLRHKVTTL